MQDWPKQGADQRRVQAYNGDLRADPQLGLRVEPPKMNAFLYIFMQKMSQNFRI